MTNTWAISDDGTTAAGAEVPVTADGALVAVLTPLWDDEAGVRVSVSYDGGLDDLSGDQARALAAALVEVAGMPGPTASA